MIFLRNLQRAPARTLLTLLGVAAGMALFVAVTAITLDVRAQIRDAASAYHLEVVAYERRATSPVSSRISAETMEVLRARYAGALTPLVLGTHNEQWNAYALVIGAPVEFLRRIPLTAGEPTVEGAGEAMIGEIAAGRLGVEPGMSIPLDGREVRLRGVYRTGSRLLDGGLMMEIPMAQRILTREGAAQQFTMAMLRAPDSAAAAAMIREVNADFPALRAIPGMEFAGAMRLMRVVEAFVRTLAVVALVGTFLVVGNALVMALAERTRELGILMAIGWSPVLVLRVLLAESLALCLGGALLGHLLALTLLRVVNGMESVGFGWIPIRYPLPLVGWSLVMAAVVAITALSWPAGVLFRMQPLAALRHE